MAWSRNPQSVLASSAAVRSGISCRASGCFGSRLSGPLTTRRVPDTTSMPEATPSLKGGRPLKYETPEQKREANRIRRRDQRRLKAFQRREQCFEQFYGIARPPSPPAPLQIMHEDPRQLIEKAQRRLGRQRRAGSRQTLAAMREEWQRIQASADDGEKLYPWACTRGEIAVVMRMREERDGPPDEEAEVDDVGVEGGDGMDVEERGGFEVEEREEIEVEESEEVEVEEAGVGEDCDLLSPDWPTDSDEGEYATNSSVVPSSQPAWSPSCAPVVGGPVSSGAPRRSRHGSVGEDEAAIDPTGFDLCEEQRQVVRLILEGRNVFYTGGAGTGKSTVLKAAVQALQRRGIRVQVVAPTGISALNVGGSTYFSWAGWSPMVMKQSLDSIRNMGHTQERRARVAETQVLIIDEISMIEANQFERLDQMCRVATGKRSLAFGGIQVVATGDFYQLPPVKAFQTCLQCGVESVVKSRCVSCERVRGVAEKGSPYTQNPPAHCADCHGMLAAFACGDCDARYSLRDQWAFCSTAWGACRFEHISLRQVHRQSDPVFIELLHALRTGQPLSEEQLGLLGPRDWGGRAAIELSPVRIEVDRKNEIGFASLAGAEHVFSCLDFAHIQKHHPELRSKARADGDGTLAGCREHRFPARLRTKWGMPVILLANVDVEAGLVNGSQGKIVGFVEGRQAFGVRRGELERSGKYSGVGEEQVERWMQRQRQGAGVVLPRVQFENGVTRTVFPVCQDSEVGDPEPFSVIARTQIPLLPAWAITMHKSQGMTLERAVVNLDAAFEPAMAYVAVSRVRSLEGLSVVSRVGVSVLQAQGRIGGASAEVQRFMAEQFGRSRGEE